MDRPARRRRRRDSPSSSSTPVRSSRKRRASVDASTAAACDFVLVLDDDDEHDDGDAGCGNGNDRAFSVTGGEYVSAPVSARTRSRSLRALGIKQPPAANSPGSGSQVRSKDRGEGARKSHCKGEVEVQGGRFEVEKKAAADGFHLDKLVAGDARRSCNERPVASEACEKILIDEDSEDVQKEDEHACGEVEVEYLEELINGDLLTEDGGLQESSSEDSTTSNTAGEDGDKMGTADLIGADVDERPLVEIIGTVKGKAASNSKDKKRGKCNQRKATCANSDVDPIDDHNNTKENLKDMNDPETNAQMQMDTTEVHNDVLVERQEMLEAGPKIVDQDIRTDLSDSDDDVEILNEKSSGTKDGQMGKFKPLVLSSCVAWRTRSLWGTQNRVNYDNYFEVLSDDPDEDDDDDDTTDEEDGDDNDDEDEDDDDDDDEGDYCEESGEEFAVSKKDRPRYIYGKKKLRNTSNGGLSDSDSELDLKDKSDNHPTSNWNIHSQKPMPLLFNSAPYEKQRKFNIFKRRFDAGNYAESDSDPSFSNSDAEDMNGKNRDQGDVAKLESRESNPEKSGNKPLTLTQKMRARMLKRKALLKLLIDSFDNESSLSEQTNQKDYTGSNCDPLIFSFEDDKSVPQKSEEEKALDELWAEFDFAMESENIGTYRGNEENGVETDMVELASNPMALCSRGKHQYIVDEQVGIICTVCSLVTLEIRYILPSLASNIVDKSFWKTSNIVKRALMYEDLCSNSESKELLPYIDNLYGTVWDLIPGSVATMYPHQREAFEFMWNNLAGSINLNELRDGSKPDVVGGCVICHAPGTGKTRLAIAFIQTYMTVFPECRPVIIAPRGMLFTWEEEFKKWKIKVPFHIINVAECSGKEDKEIRKLIKKEHKSERLIRLVKLLSWNKGSGILGISYGLYKNLTSDKCKNPEDEKIRSILLEKPQLLILDEGHTPRNERSVIWKTLGKVKSEKRIILSGTPFQNNFLELYNMLCLVRPQFAEQFLIKTPKLCRRKGYNILAKGQSTKGKSEGKGIWASLTSSVTNDNVDKVRAILKPFVHIHNGNILRTLPGMRECVVVLKPLALQKSIIEKIEHIGSGNNFEHEYIVSLASIHPSLATAINMTDEEASQIDKPFLETMRLNPFVGVKTRFVVEVVRLSEALKEKVLIFSQFIQPLALIKDHLIKLFNWKDGKEILQMDGKILPIYRQASIDVFNDVTSEARVLLASTRACCEGISLTGASRVVLLDVVWNPAVGRQAISRAFRIGQQKFVYTYNLITYGTGEKDKYNRQAEKDHLSKLVFSEESEFGNVRNTLSKAEKEHSERLISEDKILEEMTSHDQSKDMFLKIYYPPTESNIAYTYSQIVP